jgi:plasmid stabilization system protein ParE
MGCRFRPEVVSDLEEASSWYRLRREGLGDEFLQEVGKTLAKIEEAPRMYSQVYRDIRRALIKRFPYGIFFILDRGQVVVLAVHHHSRDPSSWQSRR